MTNIDEQTENQVFENLLDYLRQSRGFDFTGYKRASLQRRVRKQMQSHNIQTFADYLDYLQVHPEEFVPLFNTILINVTSFLRDKSAWEYLQHETLPRLLDEKSPSGPIRIWSAGCASGEEAYTLAMILADLLGVEQLRQRVKIYATDVDEEVLVQARQASYTPKAIQPIPEPFRDQCFEQVGERYVFQSDLRRAVIFGRHDLMKDAPISSLDLLVCRNTLMYFNAETQAMILNRFHFALNDTGVLFLGKAEMLLTHANIFMPLSLQHRIFRRIPNPNRRQALLSTFSMSESEASQGIDQNVRLGKLAFDALPVAQIVVSSSNILVLANIPARLMFGINYLDLGRPLQDLEISYRPLELRTPIEQVASERRHLVISDVVCDRRKEKEIYLDVHFSPLEDSNNELLGTSISFIDVTRYHQLQEDLQQSGQELETANEELQSSNEELETTNEELQSTNEELETTNEELQSSNEELETMNEELQSTNEELQTINEELRIRTTDLNHANAFLQSILASLKTAVIVVDRKFNILSWNNEAENLWGLKANEVEGQSLFSLDIGLSVDQLRDPIHNCLGGKNPPETVLPAIKRRGQTIDYRISYSPLLSSQRERQGVILLIEETDHDQD